MKSIKEIRDAFSRVWRAATMQDTSKDPALMTIPPDRERDADCVVHDAISELADLRAEVQALRRIDRLEQMIAEIKQKIEAKP